MALFAVAMLLAAEFPAGHLFIGGGAAKVYVAPQWGRLQSNPNGLGLSVEVNVETGRFLVAGTVMFAEPNWELATANARFGIFLLNGPISPYVAAGAGWLREVSPDGDLPPNILTLEGLALLGEVGIAAFRDWRFGRLNGYLQVLQPLFGSPSDPNHLPPDPKLCLLAGVRLLF